MHPESVRHAASSASRGREVEGGMRLAPGAARLARAAPGRVDEERLAAAPRRCAKVLELRSGKHRYEQERRRARGARVEEERPVPGDELVAEKTALEDLLRVLARRPGDRNRDPHVAHVHARGGRGLELDRPVEGSTVGRVPLGYAE